MVVVISAGGAIFKSPSSASPAPSSPVPAATPPPAKIDNTVSFVLFGLGGAFGISAVLAAIWFYVRYQEYRALLRL